uniref:Uncharacterized protein n=1 Tax=Anopheles melas TaxID=34690 RepID=A0A182U8X4_9DIPT
MTALPDTAKSYSISSWKRGALGAETFAPAIIPSPVLFIEPSPPLPAPPCPLPPIRPNSALWAEDASLLHDMRPRRTLPAVRQIVIDDTLRLRGSTLCAVGVRNLVTHRALHQRGRALLHLGLQFRLRRRHYRRLAPSVQIAVNALRRHWQHRLQTLAHHARLLRPPRPAKLHHIEAETTLPAIGPLTGFAVFASCPAPARSVTTTVPFLPTVPTVAGAVFFIVQVHHDILQPEQLVVRQMHVRLTDQLVLPARFALQMRMAEQRVHVLRQHVPEHLGEEGIAKLLRHLRIILDLRNL